MSEWLENRRKMFKSMANDLKNFTPDPNRVPIQSDPPVDIDTEPDAMTGYCVHKPSERNPGIIVILFGSFNWPDRILKHRGWKNTNIRREEFRTEKAHRLGSNRATGWTFNTYEEFYEFELTTYLNNGKTKGDLDGWLGDGYRKDLLSQYSYMEIKGEHTRI